MPWSTADHDVPSVDLVMPTATAPHYLYAFLNADGEPFRAGNYGAVRGGLREAVELFGGRPVGGQRPTGEITDQRLRTWKTVFEAIGLFTVEDDTIHATRFGRAVVELLRDLDRQLNGANEHIARLGAEVLDRTLLKNPIETSPDVASNADLHPMRAIWRTMRSLDNKLHWEELNRVLMRTEYEADVPAAVEHIRSVRAKYPEYTDAALSELGEPVATDRRRVTPWFARAGLGGLLITPDDVAPGYRALIPSRTNVVDSLLARAPAPVPPGALTSKDEYLRYIMEPVATATSPEILPQDKSDVDRVTAAVKEFGASKIIALSGLPGTGKSRLARMVGDILADGDPHRLMEIQFHESTSYDDFVEGFVPRSDGSGFTRVEKTLVVLNERALKDPDRRYVLIIEEFTRTNTHAVLGELLTYVEHRSRPFILAYSQRETRIAPNLVVLATMNPRDRSALTLDDAIRRRLHIVNIGPSSEALEGMLATSLPQEELEKLVAWFEKFRSILPFGHGVFSDVTSVASLAAVWEGTAVHLLKNPFGDVEQAYQEACNEFPWK
jgi:MoxR-like ATPase